jgi:hypothetical protein
MQLFAERLDRSLPRIANPSNDLNELEQRGDSTFSRRKTG